MIWVRFFWDVQAQDKNIWTYLLCAVCLVCLLLWLLVLSRLPLRVRFKALAVVVLIHLVVLGLVKIEGVDGDLVPILGWRWQTQSAEPVQTIPAIADDDLLKIGGWTQFLGPGRDCTVESVSLETNWLTHPPQELWRVAVGPGWSGFAVANGLAVTQEQRGDQEAVVCYQASSGHEVWAHTYDAHYVSTIAGEGPRATPSISEDRVYAMGSTGWLTCLDLETGELIWDRNVIAENDAEVSPWGVSASPLIVSNQVVVSVGGSEGRSLIALDSKTGTLLWTGGDDSASYSSPVLATLDRQLQIVVFNFSSIAGHDPNTGRVLWKQPYSAGHVHVAAPLVIGTNRVLFSSGYGHGSELYTVLQTEAETWSAELAWKSRRMKAKFSNLVERGGFVYGLDDGIMACIAADTGDLIWKDGRYGHGQLILAEDLLLIMAEQGELILVDLSPEGLKELAQIEVFPGKTWNPPALAGHYLFLRTDSEAVCLRLAEAF